jgi:electron transport complex protein RnfB
LSDLVYHKLAEALDQLPNAFPRTESSVEIDILKKLISEEDATLMCRLSGTMETAKQIAEKVGRDSGSVQKELMNLARKGLVWFEKKEGELRFRLAPFIVGIYEASLDKMDHELGHLFEQYMLEGGAEGIMGPQPAIHRVVPAQSAVKSEWILPYDDVRSILLASKGFSVYECICRKQQEKIGKRRCDFPLELCLSFSQTERPPGPNTISQEEALALLDRAEEIGLVHTVSNVAEGIGYVCNCCGCCCSILRGITEWGIERSVAYANYYALVDSNECTGCGICVDRCQVDAVSIVDGLVVVYKEKCIGCGLCVTGCPEEAVRLELRPSSEIADPPHNLSAWEKARVRFRGKVSGSIPHKAT